MPLEPHNRNTQTTSSINDQQRLSKSQLKKLLCGLFCVLFISLLLLANLDRDPALNKTIDEELTLRIRHSQEKIQNLTVQLEDISNRLNRIERSTALTTLGSTPINDNQSINPSNQIDDTESKAVTTNIEAMHRIIHHSAVEIKDNSNAFIAQQDNQEPTLRPLKNKQEASTRRNQALNPLPAGSQIHVVQKGDTLSSISLKYYGTSTKWNEIFEANRDKMANHNQLKVGMQLIIPSLNEVKAAKSSLL